METADVTNAAVRDVGDNGIEAQNGRPLRLVLEARDLNITMLAIPLESGRPGERIRLRNPRTGRTFAGTVVSRNTVQIDE